MSKIHFTGCRHLGHYNIIKYCNRPFESVEQQNSTIIRNNNNVVKDNDIVYDTGDFAFYSANNNGNGDNIHPNDYISQLKGNQVFINGNHDNHGNSKRLNKTHEIILKHKNLKIQLIHDPQDANVEYPLIIHSHVHNEYRVRILSYMRKKAFLFNCGVDVNDFKPVAFDTILELFYRWDNIKNNYEEVKEFLKLHNKGTNCERI